MVPGGEQVLQAVLLLPAGFAGAARDPAGLREGTPLDFHLQADCDERVWGLKGRQTEATAQAVNAAALPLAGDSVVHWCAAVD